MNFDVTSNSSLFRDLIEAKPDKLIEIGMHEYKSRVNNFNQSYLIIFNARFKDPKKL